MADNKYNQSLLDMGYTQEQIDSMVNAVRSWQDANAVVRWTNQPPRSWDVDLSTYDGTDGKGNVTTWPWNANLNYNQYWDDSHPNQQSQKWWLNEKYTWEGTSNTYIAYNPDLKTSDLDPNYLYWQAAKDQNRQEAGYIARRNDNIASALYNEWRVSKEDVAQFLASQNEWMNSTEADRLNTIESVWKRLGQIKPQEEEPQKEYDPSIIENALDEDASGRLYGKVTADEWGSTTGIDTLADANSVYKAMNEGRIANVKALIAMKPSTVAASMADWINPYWLQAWRDVQQYYPEFAADVQQQLKKIQWQNAVNAITSWWEMANTTSWQSQANNDIAEFSASNSSSTKSAAEISKDVHNAIAENQTASEASETMAVIEEDMATLKNRLKNLRQEANKIFKWDAPDYLVKAWMNNKTLEIQNQMSILEDRYNAAYNRYKTELANTQWQQEFQLKKDQFELQKQMYAVEKRATEQWVAIDWYKAMSWWTTWTGVINEWDTYQVTTMSDEEVSAAVDRLWEMYDNWQLWNAQCAAWIQKYYLPLLWISLPNLSSIENKKKLINTDASYTPKRWDLIILNSKSSPANWHMGIVLWVSNGNIEYMDWNGSLWKDWKWTEKVAINSISSKSSSILWFRNVNKNQWGTWTEYGTNMSFSNEALKAFRKFLSWEMNSAQAKVLAESYWTNIQWLRALAESALQSSWDLTATWETMSPYAESVLEAISQLYEIAAWDDWKVNFRLIKDLYKNTERNLKYAQIKSLLTLEQMTEARANEIWFWQVTEWEWKMLRQAAAALGNSVWTTDEAINNELEKIIRVLWKASYGSNITQLDWLNYRNKQAAIDNWNNAEPTNYPLDTTWMWNQWSDSSSDWVVG